MSRPKHTRHRRDKKPNKPIDGITDYDFHGFTLACAMGSFKTRYESHRRKGTSFRVIHGYGRDSARVSLIKTWLREFLVHQSRHDRLQFTDHLNPGATLIHPIDSLVDEPGWLDTFARTHRDKYPDIFAALYNRNQSHQERLTVTLHDILKSQGVSCKPSRRHDTRCRRTLSNTARHGPIDVTSTGNAPRTRSV